MMLRDILQAKGTQVHTIQPDATLADVVQLLVQYNCGSLVVTEPDKSAKMVGIITERDILRACAGECKALEKHTVAERMTRKVITGSPDLSVAATMGILTRNRIRHMPVVDDDLLVGIISIGDVVKAQHDALSMENHYLKSYLLG